LLDGYVYVVSVVNLANKVKMPNRVAKPGLAPHDRDEKKLTGATRVRMKKG